MNLEKFNQPQLSIGQKLLHLNWGLVLIVGVIAGAGFAMLYSAANGNVDPWASRQMVRFGAGFLIMIAAALIDIRHWMRLAYPLYVLGLALLVLVEFRGTIGMGAQRWINLGLFQLQPSEVMKVTLVLALARYFHGGTPENIGRLTFLIPPLLMVVAPVVLVLKQPDLGTAIMLTIAAGALFFLAGARMWIFAIVGGAGLAAIPVGWQFLHAYQKKRVLTFLNPESDPLGSGYHIMQSKIALGSGGLFGKGFMLGSQSHLNFLPEKHTDFIFTMFAEEFGLVGGLALLGLYALILVYGFGIALRSRSHFGRLLAMGVSSTFFVYIFVNIAMVMGLIPVVGVPLPLVSYGGTALLSLMFSFGLLLSVYIHRDIAIGRRGLVDDD
ncbi:MAG: rod shape-determining protein RodA [Rhodospirillales bacterium]|nr:rod shape-determining protein RodA [Rhodospirillales bacterium]MCW8971493.1 rod shape-determining protein RodA [Rhodospirillales bacterium]